MYDTMIFPGHALSRVRSSGLRNDATFTKVLRVAVRMPAVSDCEGSVGCAAARDRAAPSATLVSGSGQIDQFEKHFRVAATRTMARRHIGPHTGAELPFYVRIAARGDRGPWQMRAIRRLFSVIGQAAWLLRVGSHAKPMRAASARIEFRCRSFEPCSGHVFKCGSTLRFGISDVYFTMCLVP